MISIIDYGTGNVTALANILRQLKIPFKITNDSEIISKSDKYILPGVGSFDSSKENLENLGIYDLLREQVLEHKKHLLGICIGMHLLANESQEGLNKGLGWISGIVKKIDIEKDSQKSLYLPHMGWNSIKPKKSDHPILKGIDINQGFYFLHNYYFNTIEDKNILATFSYGKEFPCIVFNENIYGIQFHPEKSHTNGIKLIDNFNKL